ncbi:autophagy-related protein 27-domain-containing protein [Mycena rosella]|uniref:Autophagy-related protein 27 n=1 Tax=Mycena rosella TaxID=1033263 RepID=A0AAD7CGX8_MYCRO|nr:autophagy-related protein 27-domain-containing protein [Mycena rosella]
MRPRWTSDATDHASRCSFTLDSLEFDLCPLFKGTSTIVEFDKDTPPTRTTHRYNIGLGAPLKKDGTLGAELQCPEGTWICLTFENRRPSHPSEPMRIIQVIPVAGDLGLNPTAKMLAKADAADLHAPLQITLHGGLYNGQSQKASFQLHCDHDADEETAPSFAWQWNGTHTFSWRTKRACPRALPPGAPGPRPEEPDVDPPTVPSPPDPDADVEGRERTTRPPSLSIYIVLFWVFARRLSLRFSVTSRSVKGFRPPASIRGEETPLTPNSRATFMIGRYGSAG